MSLTPEQVKKRAALVAIFALAFYFSYLLLKKFVICLLCITPAVMAYYLFRWQLTDELAIIFKWLGIIFLIVVQVAIFSPDPIGGRNETR